MDSFLQATALRRSVITLKKESSISDARIEEIVKHVVLNSPTPFDVDSTRVAIFLNDSHNKLWDMIYEHAQQTLPPALFNARIVPNIKATKASYGTVLFFDDSQAVDAMPPHIGQVLKSSPEWAEQANGMAQFAVWTAFATEGMGASIQHYQKGGLMKKISEEWDLPLHWDLKCQMPFGVPDGPPRGGVNKNFPPVEPKVKVIS